MALKKLTPIQTREVLGLDLAGFHRDPWIKGYNDITERNSLLNIVHCLDPWWHRGLGEIRKDKRGWLYEVIIGETEELGFSGNWVKPSESIDLGFSKEGVTRLTLRLSIGIKTLQIDLPYELTLEIINDEGSMKDFKGINIRGAILYEPFWQKTYKK